MVEERKSDDNNNSDESGSIPDEIEQMRGTQYNNSDTEPQYNGRQQRVMYQQSEVVVDSNKKPRSYGITAD